jgi:hypothetical protein
VLSSTTAALTTLTAPTTPWLLRFAHAGSLPPSGTIAAILDSYGVSAARTSIRTAAADEWSHAILTHACPRSAIERAARAIALATGSQPRLFRALERTA